MIQRHFRVVTVTIVIFVAAIVAVVIVVVAAVVLVIVIVVVVVFATSVAKCLLISHDQRFQLTLSWTSS